MQSLSISHCSQLAPSTPALLFFQDFQDVSLFGHRQSKTRSSLVLTQGNIVSENILTRLERVLFILFTTLFTIQCLTDTHTYVKFELPDDIVIVASRVNGFSHLTSATRVRHFHSFVIYFVNCYCPTRCIGKRIKNIHTHCRRCAYNRISDQSVLSLYCANAANTIFFGDPLLGLRRRLVLRNSD